MRRLVLLLAVLLLVGAAAPAGAAGAGGIDLSPVPAVKKGKPVTAFHVDLPRKGSREVRYALRNLTADPKTARVFAVSATRSASGAFSVGSEASSPYVSLPAHTVRLGPHETRMETFTLTGSNTLESTAYAAVVLEVTQGSVNQRVAVVVYLQPEKPWDIPLIAVIAAALVVLVGMGVVGARRRQRSAPASSRQRSTEPGQRDEEQR